MQLKEMLNEWITILTEDNKNLIKKKKKNREYGIIRQIKLRYAKAMNGTKVSSRKIDNILKQYHLSQLQVVYNRLK
jgi:hypothetical protein